MGTLWEPYGNAVRVQTEIVLLLNTRSQVGRYDRVSPSHSDAKYDASKYDTTSTRRPDHNIKLKIDAISAFPLGIIYLAYRSSGSRSGLYKKKW